MAAVQTAGKTNWTNDVPKNSIYGLHRNYAGSARLNLQYYQGRDVIGYLLHPDIPITEGMRIADVACGTGMWLLDVASKVPESAMLDGFDISPAQFPHPSTLPDNIRFSALDGAGEVPEELVGKYDVIHVSLITLVVKNNDPSNWIKNLMSMLKPGGHLQWQEANMTSYYERLHQDCDPIRFPYMFAFKQYQLKSKPQLDAQTAIWMANLDEHFLAHGLQNVQMQSYPVPKRYWRAWTETTMLTCEELSKTLENHQVIFMLEKIGEELKDGATFPGVTPMVVIGQKPLE